MKLRALKNRGKYVSDKAYIDAVYRANKEVIDLSLDTAFTSGRRAFGANVRAIKYDKNLQSKLGKRASQITTKEAVDYLSRTRIFTSLEEQASENALKGLKGHKEELKQIRRMTGWHDKLKSENIGFDENNEMLYYQGSKGRVYFEFSNSPKELKIYDPTQQSAKN